MEAVRDAFLFQHVADPTHYRGDQTPNTLDLIFTNEDKMVKELRHTAPLGKSHHQVLHFQYTCYLKAPVSGSERYAYAKGDYDSLCEGIKAHDWEEEMRGM